MLSSESPIAEADVRKMVSLLGEVAGMSGSFSGKKRRLMDGVSDLIGADCWIWGQLLPIKLDEKPGPAGFMHGGFSEERYTAFLEAVEHPDMGKLNAPFIQEVYRRGSHTTRLRQQIDPENVFRSLPVYPLWQKADIAPILLSCHPFPDDCLSLVGFYRKASAPLFTRRESRIAHVIFSEVQWLHAQSWPQAKRFSGQRLSPRLRTTLNLLLEGLGRKRIASHIGISEYTVSGYVKEIYRFYEVHSQAELLNYFREGDGGDQ